MPLPAQRTAQIQSLVPVGELLETYRCGLESSAGPADWRTELKLTLL